MNLDRTGRTDATPEGAQPRGSCALARRPRGFTLVELAMVLATAALLAAIAAPRYAESLRRYRLIGAAKRVAGDLQRAPSAAIAGGAPVSLSFNLVSELYTIDGAKALDAAGDLETIDLKSGYSINLYTASFGGQAALEFSGFGVPSASGSIELRSGRRLAVTITVQAQTGVVSISGSELKAPILEAEVIP